MDSINCKNKNKALTGEQKQKRSDYQKQYRKNMTEEQKQKIRDYQREYHKTYYAAKKSQIIKMKNKNNYCNY